jgi:hypothetical protein
MRSSININPFKKRNFLRRKNKGGAAEQDQSESSVDSNHQQQAADSTGTESLPVVTAPPSKQEEATAKIKSRDNITSPSPSDRVSVATTLSSEKSLPGAKDHETKTIPVNKESSPALKTTKIAMSSASEPAPPANTLLGMAEATQPPARPTPSAMRSEVSERVVIDDPPQVVRSYDAIAVLDQTKLPRGGVSIETSAVGRVQVSHRCTYGGEYDVHTLLLPSYV